MLLQAFRVAREDVDQFLLWAESRAMEKITVMYTESGSAVVLFRASKALTEHEIVQSGLRARFLTLPRFNIEVDDLDTLDSIRAGNNPFSIGAETINEYISDVLRQSTPITVRTTRDNQTYVIFPDQGRGWKYAHI